MNVGYGIVWLLLGVVWFGLVGLIVFLVVRLGGVGGMSDHGDSRAADQSPEQILDRMFALGEIDEATYRARRTALAEMQHPS